MGLDCRSFPHCHRTGCAAGQRVAGERTGVRVRGGSYNRLRPGKDTRTNASLNAEWVQLKNTASNHKYVFKNISIGAGKTVKIHTGTGKDTSADTFQNRKAYVWNNDGDTATLTRSTGAKVDTCSWTKKTKDHKWC
ncbi:lamin tail domain-containing protein [Streptomyces niveiscabiei]|uniref:lamin tail domain-containing protein n=1 Tax=Streptomyces niveiscabiei TaxID=164115 RepID=UPI00099EC6BB